MSATKSRRKKSAALPTALSPNPKIRNKDAKWSDIVVFDDTLGQGEKPNALRAAGKPVKTPTNFTTGVTCVDPYQRDEYLNFLEAVTPACRF